MYIGGNNVEKLYIGDIEVEKVYLGTDVIYEKASPTPTGGIHLTSDGMGIVFPAGTYQNEDGNPDFQEYTSGGSTQSDSVTFSGDVTFPSEYHNEDYSVSERYDWRESNVTITKLDTASIKAYVYGNYNRDDYSPYYYTYNACQSVPSGSATPGLSWKSYSSGSTNVEITRGETYSGWSSQNYQYINYTKVQDTSCVYTLPTSINIAIANSGSKANSIIDKNSVALEVFNSSTNTVIKTYPITFASYSTYSSTWNLDLTQGNTLTLGENEYFRIRFKLTSYIKYSSYNYDPIIYVYCYIYGKVMSPGKVVKLGLSGHTFSEEGYSDKNIILGEDTRPGWNLGYVKFSDTEEGKLVQYSKNPIT